MPINLLVVTHPANWPLEIPGVEVISARNYLTDSSQATRKGCRVFNLCRSYRYQSLGYYVSLLAEARGHKPLPRIGTIQDLKSQSIIRVISDELDQVMQKSLAYLQQDHFTLSIYFSRNLAEHHARLSRELFNLFPVPLLRAEFLRTDGVWRVQNIGAISMRDIPESHRPLLVDFATDYFERNRAHPRRRAHPRFNLAVLLDQTEATPPSDRKAIDRFVRAGERASVGVDLIDKSDYGRVGEYDALFIRSTTAVNNITYRFARRAEADGLVVIDDPESIVKCTNKVFLAELLGRHGVPTPRTEILHRDNVEPVLEALRLPLVLKQPDSAFSIGVVKVETEDEYRMKVRELLESSDLLIAQEYRPTAFDWRIGILDGRPLYACKYFMARGHWQIYNNERSNEVDFSGDFETLPIELAPKRVVRTALKAADLIGNSLYGVDLKESDRECFVIEVNDNPNIDAGVEDKLLGPLLYDRIIEVFLKRLEARRDARSSFA